MPKTDWNAKPIPFFATKFSKAKPVSSSETAIIPLSLVISVPFQWEEKPGKPLLMDKNPGSAVLPAPFPSCNPFINEAENVFDGFAFHVSGRDCQSDSRSSAMDNGEIKNIFLKQVFCGFYERNSANRSVLAELEVKSCNTNRSHLVKRTLTLGELILLSRRLSCPKNAVYVGEQRLFSMVKPALHEIFFSPN
ncbi:hypothetical protein MA16_Dca013946 [Dendrobium catenatum]|uniref:Uncharacterized protein n=1 Tax=Dendrobium catenatum TaxID=906689 RepID=A0A2I0XGF9_9ASPA|nr:hypothetical protein MA16_Dca013946 [Dendrobium catenatum]